MKKIGKTWADESKNDFEKLKETADAIDEYMLTMAKQVDTYITEGMIIVAPHVMNTKKANDNQKKVIGKFHDAAFEGKIGGAHRSADSYVIEAMGCGLIGLIGIDC